MTKVVFRTFKNGEVIALFPYEQEQRGRCMSYMHVGQHSCADYNYCIGETRLATKDEYQPLYDELKSIGYDDLVIIKRKKN